MPEETLEDQKNIHKHLFPQKQSKAVLVYNYLREEIIAGHWNPGDRINDNDISELLNVSRISVREALSKLVQDEIVEQVQWKGYYLRQLTSKDINSFIEVRVALEQLAVTNFLNRENSSFHMKMDETINASEKLLSGKKYREYMIKDFEFHELLYRGSGNQWIQKIITNARVQINILRNRSMGDSIHFEQAAIRSISDHRKILEALKVGDLTESHRLLKDHFETHRNNIINESTNV